MSLKIWRPYLGLSLIILLLCACISAPGFADQVFFKDTSLRPIEGQVVTASEQAITLQLPSGEKIPINRSMIARIEFSKASAKKLPKPSDENNAPLPNASKENPAPQPVLDRDESVIYDAYALFPDRNGQFDSKQITALSQFKGEQSQQLYAGLYFFPSDADSLSEASHTDTNDRAQSASAWGTFWIKFTESQHKPGSLRFSLFGKQNMDKATEPFSLQGRFLDINGHLLGTSAIHRFQTPSSTLSVSNSFIEWFQLLAGLSGVSGEENVQWKVPAHTKTVELQVTSAPEASRHLVGYLSKVIFIP